MRTYPYLKTISYLFLLLFFLPLQAKADPTTNVDSVGDAHLLNYLTCNAEVNCIGGVFSNPNTYLDLTTTGSFNIFGFSLILPGATSAFPASSTGLGRARAIVLPNGGTVRSNFTKIICSGANISGINGPLAEIGLEIGESCDLTLEAPGAAGQPPVQYFATFSRDVHGYAVSTGNIYGGFLSPPPDTISPTLAISGFPSSVIQPFTATFTFSEDVTGFVRGDIIVSNATVSNFTQTSASEYTAKINPIARGQITIDVAAAAAKDLSGNDSLEATQVVTNYIDEEFVRTRTQRVISNFIGRRADQITANDPELVNRLQNRETEGESGQPVGFTADGTLTNNKLAFSTSLRQMMVAKEKEKSELRNGLGDMMNLGQQSLTNNIDPNGWDLWVKGTWAQTESDTASNDLGLLHLGVDYRFSPSLLIGFLTQFDWTDEKDSVENFKVEGQGWMAGPYMVARLHENLLFDGRVAWGQSENDVSPFNTYTDQFDTIRWLLKGQLTGDFKAANWHFAPHVGVLYFEEKQDAYTDSLNVYIPGQTISLGRLTFGPKIRTSIETSDGTIISPHLSLKGIWDFDKAEVVDLDTGLAAGASEDLRARVEGGLSVRMSNGWSLNGEGFYDGIGVDDLKAYGGSVKLTVPLN